MFPGQQRDEPLRIAVAAHRFQEGLQVGEGVSAVGPHGGRAALEPRFVPVGAAVAGSRRAAVHDQGLHLSRELRDHVGGHVAGRGNSHEAG